VTRPVRCGEYESSELLTWWVLPAARFAEHAINSKAAIIRMAFAMYFALLLMAQSAQSPCWFVVAFAFAVFPFSHLHILSIRLRHHDEPRIFQQCNYCNGRACNMDMFVQSPSQLGQQL
jgi:hypothetical protein